MLYTVKGILDKRESLYKSFLTQDGQSDHKQYTYTYIFQSSLQ
jgi:hypothetical protein